MWLKCLGAFGFRRLAGGLVDLGGQSSASDLHTRKTGFLQAVIGLGVVLLSKTDAGMESQVLLWQHLPILVIAAWASSCSLCQASHSSEPVHHPVAQVPGQ